MIKRQAILTLLLLVPLAMAQDDADAVNERIPVNKADLETHWKVDCTHVQQSLLAAAAQRTAGENCGIPATLKREAQLCAFIYQAPGDSSPGDCPDYRGISQQLEQAVASGECSALLASIRNKLDCESRGTTGQKGEQP